MYTTIQNLMVIAYTASMAVLAAFGTHRYWQLILYYRVARKPVQPVGKFSALPKITVQLPLFNERFVAQRVIEAACKLNYPPELLQIQVLDDSTDESALIAESVCRRMCEAGHHVQYIHRTDRTGYKAGALANGLQSATGEYIAIFDADFVPLPDMLQQSVHFFTDPTIACVQSRWEHINRHQSLLTVCQAILLDGHFMIEHTARNRSGRFINFNGTGGIWRRSAIDDAGGWQHDTLTEDMDLSYRAQMRNWKMVFLPDLVSPAELPPEIISFKQQQHRWTKGIAQTAVKLLPAVLRSKLPLRVKLEAFFHLTSGIVYPPAVALALLVFPTFAFGGPSFLSPKSTIVWYIMMGLFTLMTFSAGAFYVASQRELGRNWLKTILLVPFLMAIGAGISLANAVAVLEGIFGRRNCEFIRTPKYGVAGDEAAGQWKARAGHFKRKINWIPLAELTFGFYLFACLAMAVVWQRDLLAIPFLMIFMTGYFYVGGLSLYNQWIAGRADPQPLPIATPPTEAISAAA